MTLRKAGRNELWRLVHEVQIAAPIRRPRDHQSRLRWWCPCRPVQPPAMALSAQS
jgi:hypothetical protein